MQTYTVKEGSLIHRLIMVYTPDPFVSVADDICKLIRQVIGRILMIAFCVLVFTAWVAGLLDTAMWLYLGHHGDPHELAYIITGMTFIIGAVALVVYGWVYLYNLYKKWRNAHNDKGFGTGEISFLEAAWDSIHNKICFPVKFVRAKDEVDGDSK